MLTIATRRARISLCVFAWVATYSCTVANEIVDDWRYTFREPEQGWEQADFDDSGWRKGKGGFGRRNTPGARVGVRWDTPNIWLRKSLQRDQVPANTSLLVHHDDDAEVFLNGEPIAELEGFTTDYVVVPIDLQKMPKLKPGKNVLAVHCKQAHGGQFIDVHLIDASSLPKLPQPESMPFRSDLITTWGEQVTTENAWREYPRPQLTRPEWQNLNGQWDYAVTPRGRKKMPLKWAGKILVPFCLESRLSGVQKLLEPTDALWYRRSFDVTVSEDERTLIHFEAVDYQCQAFVNGTSVGTHRGGNTPFSFDITEAVRSGVNELVVCVTDRTEDWQLRGKQVLDPRGIWYTRVSGIWQTVWLEQVPTSYIEDIKIATDAGTGTIVVQPVTKGTDAATMVSIRVNDNGTRVAEASGASGPITIVVDDPKLWSPDSPHLYDLEVSLSSKDGQIVDRVESYAGIRTVGKVRDAHGHWRFTLNDEPIFHWGTLDQGWWPDGLLTPPSDAAMRFDVEWLKRAGFNMIRKHIKVEPRRYYYHCDRLGMLLWQDNVSGGTNPPWSRLEPGPRDAQWPQKRHQQFMLELEQMVDALENHPSIVVWVPFNERWGQHRTMKVGEWLVERDPSRLVNIASGGNFWPVGDIVDAHKYPHPEFPFDHGIGGRFNDYVKVVGEFGGHGYPVAGHLWDAERRNWGYGNIPKNQAEYTDRYETSIRMLNDLRHKGIAGGVYTQTTDVEGEINGLMTYDRRVIKIPAETLEQLHRVLFADSALDESIEPNPNVQTIQTDRKPGKTMDAQTIREGLKSHDRALFIKEGWIRDPYITLGPDDYYYLTGTQPREANPHEEADPYNIGLGEKSIVGDQVRVYRSKDLADWESLGPVFTLDDTYRARSGKVVRKRLLWAPELHWLGDRWALVHCPKVHSSLALSDGIDLDGPWTHPMSGALGQRHDPSLFQDDDGTWYLLWQNTLIAPLSSDLAGYAAEPVRIDPAGSRPGPDGKPINRIGHEGATMIKVNNKYVHLGTAWSTDRGRKGSYNLYYCVADEITGPYGPRKFAGRFLGHGTPFQTRDGKWWCTAFFNANVPPLPRDGIRDRDLRDNAQTINEQGVTIVPLDVKVLDDGEIHIRAKDPDYAVPGPDEAQKFATEIAF